MWKYVDSDEVTGLFLKMLYKEFNSIPLYLKLSLRIVSDRLMDEMHVEYNI